MSFWTLQSSRLVQIAVARNSIWFFPKRNRFQNIELNQRRVFSSWDRPSALLDGTVTREVVHAVRDENPSWKKTACAACCHGSLEKSHGPNRIQLRSVRSSKRHIDPFRARHGVTVKETTKRQLPDVPFIVFVHADDLFLGKTK